jgi:uncharacterized protein YndB with AHSA1/START domain
VTAPPDPPPDPLPLDRAPVSLELEARIAGAPDAVWAVLADVQRWPRWHRGVGLAILRGELAPGTRLDWRADGMRIRSIVTEVEPARRLGLTTRMIGGRGYLRWTLEPLADGGTRVRTEEVWEGLAVSLLRRTLRRTLRISRTHWLEALKEQLT